MYNQPAGLDPDGLQPNGSSGPLTVALVRGSLAIDAANPATATDKDEREITRPQGSAPDIGSFESSLIQAPAPATPTPAPTPDGGGDVSDRVTDGSGCSLSTLSKLDNLGYLSLLCLTALGFVAWRRGAAIQTKRRTL